MFQASVLGRAQFPRRLLHGLGDDAPPDSSSWLNAIGTDIANAAAAVTGSAAGTTANITAGSHGSSSAWDTIANDVTSIATAIIGANGPKPATPVPAAPSATKWYTTWWGIGAIGLGGLGAFALIRRVL